MNRWSALALLLTFGGALAWRVPQLETRPFHNDEAVNAVKVSELWQEGRYLYDPDEYHGPTLHYASLPLLWLSPARTPAELSDGTLRLTPILFGAGLILLLLLLIDGLGRSAILWAALFTALSPAMVFYSRYFIHEMLLVFFTALTLGAGWRYHQNPSNRWAVLIGIGIGLMFATKETFVITLAAGVPAAVLTTWLMTTTRPRWQSIFTLWNWKHAACAGAAALVVWLLFFSSFFTNMPGLLDSIRTYLPWIKRAGGESPHIHPWYFYLQRLAWFHPSKGPVWSEGLILSLAVIGAVSSLVRRKEPLAVFIALYTILLTLAYTIISYKTPWCLLNFFYGMILLAGVGATTLVGALRGRTARVAVIALLLGLTAQLAWQARRASLVYAADPRNPYVYAQTAPDILHLLQKVEGLAGVASTAHDTIVKVIAPHSDYWPLPWSLRRFKNVGYYDELPSDPFAPIVISSSKLNAHLDDKSDRKWIMAGLFELRPKIFFELYVEFELWKKYVETLPRPVD